MMKRILLIALAMVFGMTTFAGVTQAALIYEDVFNIVDPVSGGELILTERVYDNWMDDFSLYQWDYEVFNISYDPNPVSSNGLSGFNLVFPAEIPELGNQYGPAGWFMNCCGTTPPFGAEWDINNSTGFGIPIGGTDNFGFTTAPRFDVVMDTGSWMHTWENDVQTFIFDIGLVSLPGDLKPVPEPATLILLGSGIAGLAFARRRMKK